MTTETWQDYYSQDNLAVFGPEYVSYRESRAPLEAGFALQRLSLAPAARVLDLCCGFGHNAIYLAMQGLNVIAADASGPSVARGREFAKAAGARVDFREVDARKLPWTEDFDAVVMLFNSFGYCRDDEDNWLILGNAARALKPGGGFLIDVLNRDHALALAAKGVEDFAIADGGRQRVAYEFEDAAQMFHLHREIADANGKIRARLNFSQKAYRAEQVEAVLKAAHVDVRSVFGNYEGGAPNPESSSLILIGNKRA